MRARFRASQLEGFAEHEVLELLLFYGRARGDVNPLAHDLLNTFGTLKGVMEAMPEQLMKVKGVGEETATFISLMLPLFRRYKASVCEGKVLFGNKKIVEDYCMSYMMGRQTERFYVIGLSASGRVLGERLIAEGTVSEVCAYPRKIAEAALDLNAHTVLLCHNHPGGVCFPSQDDLDTTDQIEMLLNMLGIRLMDHVIVAGAEAYSMELHEDLLHQRKRKQSNKSEKEGKT